MRSWAAAFALCGALALCARAQEVDVAAPSAAESEAAVREVVARYAQAREMRDGRAIEALFAADADQLTSSGEWRRGREAVVRGSLATSERSGGTRQITVEAVRFPAPDVAIADGRYEIRGTANAGNLRLRTTFVLTRGRDGGWRITAIRNMAPTPAGTPASAAEGAAPPPRRIPR